MRVYIAGPYTKGDVAINVRDAILMAEELIKRGHVPFIPHLSHFWHLVAPHGIDFWYDYDNNFLDHWADCVLRLPGESVGADKEVFRAGTLGLPVYYDIEDLP